jgi:hypothetical protein
MRRVIDTQRAAREVRDLPFCYLCCEPLDGGGTINDDHVPPHALFLSADRDFPLILPTHEKCNHEQSKDDQIIGQLVGMLHGKKPDEKHSKLRVSVGRFNTGALGLAVTGLDLRGIIRRWVRGFHAALYRECLPEATGRFVTTPPLPEAEPGHGAVRSLPVADVIPEFVKELKRNRATGSLDRIVCRNGQCRYECVWVQADRGKWLCIYALNIYDWAELGDSASFERRGCVGAYRRPGGGVPRDATCGTRLLFDINNQAHLDPFGA